MHRTRCLPFLFIVANLPFGVTHVYSNQDRLTIQEPVTLQTAVELALARDPRLSYYKAIAEAAQGQIDQADVRPNPVVAVEVENILGTGPFRHTESMEVTLEVRQLIETASKRQRRTELERSKRELVDWERVSVIAKIESGVQRAFTEVLLWRESVTLRREQFDLAQLSREETARLLDAAQSSLVEQSRANLAVTQARFALQQAESQLDAARNALAALWGITPPATRMIEGVLRLEEEPPSLPDLIRLLPETPALARFDAVSNSRQAELRLERARARPDIEAFAGARYSNEGRGDSTFLLGVEMPWPLFNKNEGNIRSARAGVHAVQHERTSVQRELVRQLSATHRDLTAAFQEAKIIETGLIPAAEEILKEMESGYSHGQFSRLAVLESRQALFALREAHLTALTRYTKAQTEIKALTRPAQLTR